MISVLRAAWGTGGSWVQIPPPRPDTSKIINMLLLPVLLRFISRHSSWVHSGSTSHNRADLNVAITRHPVRISPFRHRLRFFNDLTQLAPVRPDPEQRISFRPSPASL